jgi:hypothetical protein
MTCAHEPNLFAIYPDAPGHRGVATSIEAADAIAPKIGRLQRMTLEAIAVRGAFGCTADEVSDLLGVDHRSTQPRATELKLKGLIVDSGLRRLNATGRRAIVWVTPENKRSAA